MEELSIGSCPDLIDNSWLEIKEYSSWDMLSSTGLREKGAESVVTTTDGFIWGHLAIWQNTMLEAEKLPTGVTNLDTGLTDVDVDDFSHD